MLKLRRATVTATDPLTVEVAGTKRRAWADDSMVGAPAVGDQVLVNTEAADRGLGSGGFDIVYANLSSGLASGGEGSRHVMKLNYTPLQHAVEPVEPRAAGVERHPPVLVLFLHGQLAPAAWAAAQARPGLRVGYVQTAGGALPGSLSHTVRELRERELICDHVTAGPAYGGEHEAVTTIGALQAAAAGLGWDAIIAGPGPGILGSETAYGHGGMVALDTAHAALALGLPTILAPRVSGADERPRHRDVSHHTEHVLGLLLAPVAVAAAEVDGRSVGALRKLCAGRHELRPAAADLDGFAASGIEATTMGRGVEADPRFFAAALAGGGVLAAAVSEAAGIAG